MKTTELNKLAFKYILDSIKDVETIREEYGDSVLDTQKDRINWVYEDFKRVANHPYNINKFPNEIDRFADYLRGAPSVIEVEQWNDDILELAKKWGYEYKSKTAKGRETEEYKIINNWYNFIANKFFQLKKRVEKKDIVL